MLPSVLRSLHHDGSSSVAVNSLMSLLSHLWRQRITITWLPCFYVVLITPCYLLKYMVISKYEIAKMFQTVLALQFSNTIYELSVSLRVSFIVQYLKNGSCIPAYLITLIIVNLFLGMGEGGTAFHGNVENEIVNWKVSFSICGSLLTSQFSSIRYGFSWYILGNFCPEIWVLLWMIKSVIVTVNPVSRFSVKYCSQSSFISSWWEVVT